MRKRVRIALAVLLIALVSVIIRQMLQTGEPVYQGKPLSSWLRGYGPFWQVIIGTSASPPLASDAQRQRVDEVVRQVGTNALPTLLRMLRAKDSALKVKLMDLARRQHIITIQHTPAGDLNHQAAFAFKALGATARSAVPRVMEIAERKVSPASQYSAIVALGGIGPPGKETLPSLLRGATNANCWFRSYTISALGSIHSEADRVVPVLINALHDPDPYVRPYATDALKQTDPEAAARAGVR